MEALGGAVGTAWLVSVPFLVAPAEQAEPAEQVGSWLAMVVPAVRADKAATGVKASMLRRALATRAVLARLEVSAAEVVTVVRPYRQSVLVVSVATGALEEPVALVEPVQAVPVRLGARVELQAVEVMAEMRGPAARR